MVKLDSLSVIIEAEWSRGGRKREEKSEREREGGERERGRGRERERGGERREGERGERGWEILHIFTYLHFYINT